MRLAVIGTAGRNKAMRPYMTPSLWLKMLEDLRQRVKPEDVLVSGGAAWSDHLAVVAFKKGWVTGLKLFLPAPIIERSSGQLAYGEVRDVGEQYCEETRHGLLDCGAVANIYHGIFCDQMGQPRFKTIESIIEVEERPGCSIEVGQGFHARNKQVAWDSEGCIAYSWDRYPPPEGGTGHTWGLIPGPHKTHVSLYNLLEQEEGGLRP